MLGFVLFEVIKGIWYTLKEDNSVKISLSFSQIGVYPIRKEFAPSGSKFFPHRVDPFSEEAWCAVKQTEKSHNSYLPFKNRGESTKCTQPPLSHLVIMISISIKITRYFKDPISQFLSL